MSKHVLPTAPSPTTTHYAEIIKHQLMLGYVNVVVGKNGPLFNEQ